MNRPERREASPLDWPAQAGAVDDVLGALEGKLRRRRARRRRGISAVAALGVIAMVGAAWALRVRSATSGEVAVAVEHARPATLVSQPERQVLADGSIVELKQGARIRVAFTATRRSVTLEKGEAHFQVAKNPERPFVVTAGNVQFRAVGTAFSVERGQREVELFVTEGRVAVDQPAAVPASGGSAPTAGATPSSFSEPQTLAVVDAGHRVVVTAADAAAAQPPQVVAVSPAQVSQRLAWRVPTLEFSGTPLGEALPLFNEHGKAKLVLGDPELATVRLSGMIRADNIDTLLALLADSYGIRAERRGETEIVLHHGR